MTHHAWIIPHRQQGSLRAGTCSPLRPETQRIRLRFARSTFLPRLKRRRGSAPAARGKDAQRRAVRGAVARITERCKRSSPWGRRSDRGKTRRRQHHGRRGSAPDDEKTKRRPGSRKDPARPESKKAPAIARDARPGKTAHPSPFRAEHVPAAPETAKRQRPGRPRKGRTKTSSPWGRRQNRGKTQKKQPVGPSLGSRKDEASPTSRKTRHRPAPDDEKTKQRPGWRKARPPGIKKKPLRAHATRGPETQRIRLRFTRSTFLPRLKRRRGSAPAARGKDAQRRAARGPSPESRKDEASPRPG